MKAQLQGGGSCRHAEGADVYVRGTRVAGLRGLGRVFGVEMNVRGSRRQGNSEEERMRGGQRWKAGGGCGRAVKGDRYDEVFIKMRVMRKL